MLAGRRRNFHRPVRLQWVHGRITVVMPGPDACFPGPGLASMGPRSDNRGYGSGHLASGLLGSLQMGAAALGALLVAALPHGNALGLIVVVCGLVALSFGFGVCGLTLAWRREQIPPAGGASPTLGAAALPQVREDSA